MVKDDPADDTGAHGLFIDRRFRPEFFLDSIANPPAGRSTPAELRSIALYSLDRESALPSEDVMWEVLDGAAVLLDVRSGISYTLNATGTKIWCAMSEGRLWSQTTSYIAGTYHVSQAVACADVLDFVNSLRSEHLLTSRRLDMADTTNANNSAQSECGENPVATAFKQPYEAPKLTKHEGLVDLPGQKDAAPHEGSPTISTEPPPPVKDR